MSNPYMAPGPKVAQFNRADHEATLAAAIDRAYAKGWRPKSTTTTTTTTAEGGPQS